MFKQLRRLRNTRIEKHDITETVISALGVGLVMLCMMWGLHWLNPSALSWFIVASLGSSALIVLSTPHAPMAQPWSVLGGQMISAIVGLFMWYHVPEAWLAASLAVVWASLLMLTFMCRHAPGAATALFFSLGGAEVELLGWSVLWLTMLPALVILITFAVLYNLPFAWRRYPYDFLAKKEKNSPPATTANDDELTPEDVIYATEQLKGFFELSEKDFMDIYRIAKAHHQDNLQIQQAENSMYRPEVQESLEDKILKK